MIDGSVESILKKMVVASRNELFPALFFSREQINLDNFGTLSSVKRIVLIFK